MTEKNKKIIIGAGALAAAITVAAAVLSLTGEEKAHETVKAGPEAVRDRTAAATVIAAARAPAPIMIFLFFSVIVY